MVWNNLSYQSINLDLLLNHVSFLTILIFLQKWDVHFLLDTIWSSSFITGRIGATVFSLYGLK